MNTASADEERLSVAECASGIGLTVRALCVYEQRDHQTEPSGGVRVQAYPALSALLNLHPRRREAGANPCRLHELPRSICLCLYSRHFTPRACLFHRITIAALLGVPVR